MRRFAIVLSRGGYLGSRATSPGVELDQPLPLYLQREEMSKFFNEIIFRKSSPCAISNLSLANIMVLINPTTKFNILYSFIQAECSCLPLI